jgi:hypothetical protein
MDKRIRTTINFKKKTPPIKEEFFYNKYGIKIPINCVQIQTIRF